MAPKRLVIIAAQSEYLKMVSFQLKNIFNERLSIRGILLNHLNNETIDDDELVFSTAEGILKAVKASFPAVRAVLKGERCINLVNTAELIEIDNNAALKILIINDHKINTDNTIEELKEAGFEHDYIPYYPGTEYPDNVDYVVTPAELDLVPEDLKHKRLINIGLRCISLETVMQLNDILNLQIQPLKLTKLHTKSMVSFAYHWPAMKKNKFISSWSGTKRDSNLDYTFADMVSKSKPMQELIFVAEKLSKRSEPVHISGANGVGKRRIGIAIHNASQYADGAFNTFNCATRNMESIEKELFGWEDRDTIYPGLLETTEKGTLCIEEIDCLNSELQGKLAVSISEGKIQRRYGELFIDISARIITTSNDTISDLFKNKTISKDLYYLLSLYTCHTPALSERLEDFDDIVADYLTNEIGQPGLILEQETVRILKNHQWEGNIQELYNVLSYISTLELERISPNYLPFYMKRSEPAQLPSDSFIDVRQIIHDIEKNGFLGEYVEILKIYQEGKRKNQSYGRAIVLKHLATKGMDLTHQQLRLRQERLNDLGLLRVRIGRAGTTLSPKGEQFLDQLHLPS